MDCWGVILNVDAPVPYPKLTYSVPSADIATIPVRARDVGFSAKASLVDGTMRSDLALRRSNAILWQFRLNYIPVEGQRACSDCTVKDLSKEFEKHQADYNKWSVAWQGKSFGNGSGKHNWFPRFVEAIVSHHNYEVHVYNLKRLFWLNFFVPTNETALERTRRISMRDSAGARDRELRASWYSKLELLMADRRTKLASIDTGDLKGQIERAREETYLTKLREELKEAKEYKPLAQQPSSNSLIPPARLYYRDMEDPARIDLWTSKWSLELATNIYHWAEGTVAIESNFKDANIGYFMKVTFLNMCRWTWNKVVAPRRLAASVAHHPLPSLRSMSSWKEDGDSVYRKFRALHQATLKAGKDFGTIEDIWVPKYNSKKRKAPMDQEENPWLP